MAKLRDEMNGSPIGGETGNKRKKARFVVYKNDDGSLDYEHLTGDDRKHFESRSGAAPSAAPAPEAPPPEFNPQLTGVMLNMLTGIEAAIVSQKYDLPPELVHRALTPQPPLDVTLTEALTRVLNKYAVSMGPWADEIALAAMVIAWQSTAFMQIRAMAAERDKRKPQAPPPNVDAKRHESPPQSRPGPAESRPGPAPAAPVNGSPAPPTTPARVVPIDMLIGATQSAVGHSAGV